jgi:hypothetical protein
MHITNDLLAAVFADSSLFCGKEDVIHAIIYHQLRKAGVSPLRIAREQALSGNRVDIVLFGDQVHGDFATTTEVPLAAIEVKNVTVLLHDCLRNVGFGTAQLSLETYFSFAAQDGSRMQDRPDLVVFDADFDGRFNLYKGGVSMAPETCGSLADNANYRQRGWWRRVGC